jgi:hypothetical protein
VAISVSEQRYFHIRARCTYERFVRKRQIVEYHADCHVIGLLAMTRSFHFVTVGKRNQGAQKKTDRIVPVGLFA